jgi:geranylgeranyl pyrophosphate synthase
MTGAEGALPPLLVTEIAPSGSAEADDAAQAIVMLEAAERAERGVHRLGGTGPHVDVDTSRDQAAALAGGWLRASATERAAGLGDEAIMRWSASLVEIADGWMREACDLYDAARTPDQYYEAAAGTRGTLGSLAAALGGLAAACEGRAVRSLAESGAKLALAAKVRDDVAALSSTEPDAGGEPPGASLLSGVYTLPVILAVDSEPKLRNSLGGAIQTDALADLVELIRSTDGPARAGGECHRLVDEALAEIEGLEAAERLSQHANQVVEDCKEAVRR